MPKLKLTNHFFYVAPWTSLNVNFQQIPTHYLVNHAFNENSLINIFALIILRMESHETNIKSLLLLALDFQSQEPF